MKEMPQSRFSSFQCALWLGLLCIVLQLPVYAEPWQDSSLAGSLRLDEEGRNLALPEPLRAEKSVPVPAVQEYRTASVDQGPSPNTLAEFSSLSLENHPRMKAARASVEEARGEAVQARLYPNPTLAGSSPQLAGADSQWNGFVSQEFVTAGKLKLAQQAALRGVQRTEYELIRARYDVLTGVRRAFYELLVAQRKLVIFKQLYDISNRSYQLGQELAAAGEGTKADTLFWSIERDRAEVRLLNATVDIETGRRELATAIGLPMADVGTIEGDLFQVLPNFDLKLLQRIVIARNADPQAAQTDIARAQWELERSVVEPIPNVTVMGGYQRQVSPVGLVGVPEQDQGVLEVSCTIPLFNRNQGNIRAARAEIAKARAGLQSVEIGLADQTARIINEYRQARRQAEWYQELILPKARETVRVTQFLYSEGELTFVRLLEAQRILTETELSYVQSQGTRWKSAAEIASLLQLEDFPLTMSTPAAIDLEFVKQEGAMQRQPPELIPPPLQ